MKIDHYFKTVSGKPASLTLLYVNNLLPGGSREKETVESSCSILTKLKMKQLSIDFGNILQLVIKPVYRHSRYDRGKGWSKKGKERALSYNLFLFLFFYFFFFAHRPPFPHLSHNVNCQHVTSFPLKPLSVFFFPPPYRPFQLFSRRQNIVKLPHRTFFSILSHHSNLTLESVLANVITGLPFSFQNYTFRKADLNILPLL